MREFRARYRERNGQKARQGKKLAVKRLKVIIRAWGMNPEEILTKNAPAKPHRTIVDCSQIEEKQIDQLGIPLRQHLLKELREESQ